MAEPHPSECAHADPGSLCDCDCAGAQHAIARTKNGRPAAGAVSKRAQRVAARDGRAAVTGNVPPAHGPSRGAAAAASPARMRSDFARWKADAGRQPPGAAAKGRPLSVYGNRLRIEDTSRVAHQHLTELETVPAPWHAELMQRMDATRYNPLGGQHAGIYVGDKGVPDLNHMAHLKGVQPRGWPPGSTWDRVPGAWDPSERKLILGGGGHGHGATSLALHEFGHGADGAAGEVLQPGAAAPASWLPGWVALHTKIAAVPGQHPYFMQSGGAGHEEAWAEGFAAWTAGRPSGAEVDELRRVFNVETRDAQAIADYFTDVQIRLERAQRSRPGRGTP